MYLVVTIDVEEDNWGAFELTQYSAKNIEKIPQLQRLFDKHDVIPTYLLSFPVATDNSAISIFKDIVHAGRCEIGAHPHPWNTPPQEEERNERNSMLCNLPSDLQLRKIKTLHETIQHNFNITPISFRSGRWGFDNCVAKNIHKLGYKIDTSVTPYTNWGYASGPNFENCTPEPYRFNVDNIFRSITDGQILEIPATIGFFQQNHKLCIQLNSVMNWKFIRTMRVRKLFDKLGILNRILVSPEVTDSQSMIKVTEVLKKKGQKVINMFFHSPSLLSGCSPFTNSIDDERKIFQTIDIYLEYCRSDGFEPVTLENLLRVIG